MMLQFFIASVGVLLKCSLDIQRNKIYIVAMEGAEIDVLYIYKHETSSTNITTDCEMDNREETGEWEITPTGNPVETDVGGDGEGESSQVSQAGSPEKRVVGRPWSTGLFDCYENQTNACHWGVLMYSMMMPYFCSQWFMGSLYRSKLRKKYGLVEAPYTDVISHVFCPWCSLCQEFRELKIRALDPVLGWKGILAQQQGELYGEEAVGIPPQIQAMSK